MILGFLLGFITCGVLVLIACGVIYFLAAMVAFNKIDLDWFK